MKFIWEAKDVQARVRVQDPGYPPCTLASAPRLADGLARFVLVNLYTADTTAAMTAPEMAAWLTAKGCQPQEMDDVR